MSLTVSKGRTFANWMLIRAITVANISEIFLDSLKIFNSELKRINFVYAYGLLHDIGALGLLQTIEQYQQDVMEIKLRDDKKNWCDAEKILYGFDHNMIGEQILMESQLPRSFAYIARYYHEPDSLKYPKSESIKIALIRLAQASLVDTHKFSEHCAFSNFSSISEDNKLIREHEDFSASLRNEFEQILSLTSEIYSEIKLSKLNDDFITNISEQF